ncbi:MAG: hypothetical protein WAN03_21755 [Candidatus Sulfotelmatobacter sp.]
MNVRERLREKIPRFGVKRWQSSAPDPVAAVQAAETSFSAAQRGLKTFC